MARVAVRTLPPISEDMWVYHVEITESDGSGNHTRHTVSLDKEYYSNICRGLVTPEEFIKRSIEFLLRREDHGSIMNEFDVKQITHYFPEYESEIKKMMKR